MSLQNRKGRPGCEQRSDEFLPAFHPFLFILFLYKPKPLTVSSPKQEYLMPDPSSVDFRVINEMHTRGTHGNFVGNRENTATFVFFSP